MLDLRDLVCLSNSCAGHRPPFATRGRLSPTEVWLHLRTKGAKAPGASQGSLAFDVLVNILEHLPHDQIAGMSHTKGGRQLLDQIDIGMRSKLRAERLAAA